MAYSAKISYHSDVIYFAEFYIHVDERIKIKNDAMLICFFKSLNTFLADDSNARMARLKVGFVWVCVNQTKNNFRNFITKC